MSSVARVRVIAGPNGSGKSTLKRELPGHLIGLYVNADDIERSLRESRRVDLAAMGVEATPGDFGAYLAALSEDGRTAPFWSSSGWTLVDGHLHVIGTASVTSYVAAVVADFVRERLLATNQSFTFETVLSSPEKLELMRRAHRLGYRVYLYFIATEDPEINVSRVRSRHERGEHDVPVDRIRERYRRCLRQLPEAIRLSDRAFVFDNSTSGHIRIAEVTDGHDLVLTSATVPAWFERALLTDGSRMPAEDERTK